MTPGLGQERYLELLDYRRRVHRLYATVRDRLATDPVGAHGVWRTARDEIFGTHPQSALQEHDQRSFGGLAYRDYDPAFVFRAPIRPLPHEPFDVDTSTGGVIPFVRFGAVDLPIGTLEVC